MEDTLSAATAAAATVDHLLPSNKTAIDDAISEYINISFQTDDTEKENVTQLSPLSSRSFSSLNSHPQLSHTKPPVTSTKVTPVTTAAAAAVVVTPVVKILAPTPTPTNTQEEEEEGVRPTTTSEAAAAVANENEKDDDHNNNKGKESSSGSSRNQTKGKRKNRKPKGSQTASTATATPMGEGEEIVGGGKPTPPPSAAVDAATYATFMNAYKQWDETLKTIELTVGVVDSPKNAATAAATAATDTTVDVVDKIFLACPPPSANAIAPLQSPREIEMKLLSEEIQTLKHGLEANLTQVGNTVKQFQQQVCHLKRSQQQAHTAQPIPPSATAAPATATTAPPSPGGFTVPKLSNAVKANSNRMISDTPRITSFVESATQTWSEIPKEYLEGVGLPQALAKQQAEVILAWKQDYHRRLQVVASKLWESDNNNKQQQPNPMGVGVQSLQRTIEEISKVSPQQKSSFVARLFGQQPKLKDPTEDAAELLEALRKQQKVNVEMSAQLVRARAENSELRQHLHRFVPQMVKLQEELSQAKASEVEASALRQEYRAKFDRALSTVKRLHEELFELQMKKSQQQE